ncbi:MAG: acyltransferase family protein [Alphaproteobacteria bacterium]|nr:acyltransferase family protein [Alphaproteobacteria bacterium]
MKYRADIDGLRCLAVVPVLFFHAGVGAFSGGYVGVDVFFVISGYLITGIIQSDLERERFSVLDFYDRRIRRIMPALIAVLLFTLAAGMILFLPQHLEALGRAAVATVMFCSNILFYTQAGYFSEPAETMPLLHTWSLAVEEQFYIFFPILLWLVHRYRPKAVFWVLAPIALASFALSAWGAVHKPAFTFFLSPTRVWELFAGAMLALGAVPAVRGRVAREVLAAAGVALIGWAVFSFSPKTAFPGANALFPVLGAALLLHVAPGTVAGRLLSTRPLVFVGLISYSLYLWHWPIIVFTQYYLMTKLAGWTAAAVIAASFAVATLSWRYIERPFRRRGVWPRSRVYAAAGSAMAVFVAAGVATAASNGLPQRFPPEVLRLASKQFLYSPRRDDCHSQEGHAISPDRSCVLGAAVPPAYAVWGDSYAVEIAYALGEMAGKNHASVAELSYSACPPALDFALPDRPGCRRWNSAVLKYLKGRDSPHTVVLAIGFARYHYADWPKLSAGLSTTTARLATLGKRVVLIYPVPEPRVEVPTVLALSAIRGLNLSAYGTRYADYLRNNARYIALLDKLPAALRAYPARAFCDHRMCRIYAQGDALYFDDDHPSISGARRIVSQLRPLFAAESGGSGASLKQASSR